MKKSDTYYVIRSLVRGMVKMFIIISAFIIIHMAAHNIWTALAFAAVVFGGVWFHDYKEQTTAMEASEEESLPVEVEAETLQAV